MSDIIRYNLNIYIVRYKSDMIQIKSDIII